MFSARTRWILASVFTGLILLLPATGWGHAKSVSYSNWRIDDETVHVSVRVSLLELTRLGIPLPVTGGRADVAARNGVGRYLANQLSAVTSSGACRPTGPPRDRPSEEGWLLFRWTLVCPKATEITIQSRILLEQAPSHLHFARVTQPAPGGSESRPRIVERVLSRSEPGWTFPTRPNDGAAGQASGEAEPIGTSLAAYLELGIEHILSGWDHLAFVLALVLLARSFGEVAKLVTGFTVAHSLTLALAVLGWVEPESAPIEAVIGFSVALIAAENGWILGGRRRAVPAVVVGGLLVLAALALNGAGHLSALTLLGLAVFSAGHFGLLRRATRPGLHRVVLAFAFGLVHGFGFAGVLAELALPTNRLAAALLGFNLGVELGQLAVVVLIWPGLLLLRRSAGGLPHRVFAEAASA
ncbi:MAG: HupE/UreJ family protein, partial [Myxococcota bacterium]